MSENINIEKFYYEELNPHNYGEIQNFCEEFDGQELHNFEEFDQAYNFSFRKLFKKVSGFAKMVQNTFDKVAKQVGKFVNKLSKFALGGISLFLAIANLKKKRPEIVKRLVASGYKNAASKGFFWQVYAYYFTIPRKKVGSSKGYDGSHVEYFVLDFDRAQELYNMSQEQEQGGRAYNLSDDQQSGIKAGADAGNSALRGDIIGGAMKVVEWIVKTIFNGKKPHPESAEANGLNNESTENKLINDPELKAGQSAIAEAEKKGLKESALLDDIKQGVKAGAEGLGIQTDASGNIQQPIDTSTTGVNASSDGMFGGKNNMIILIVVAIIGYFVFFGKKS
jgi:hypothetical protein